jgi:hypothetical protein
MFGVGPATRIYLAAGATDMRKGFEGLYGLVRDQLQLEPSDSSRDGRDTRKDGAGGRSYHFEGIDWNSADEGAASTAARTQHRKNHEGEMEVVRQMLPRCYPAIAQLAAASSAGAS